MSNVREGEIGVRSGEAEAKAELDKSSTQVYLPTNNHNGISTTYDKTLKQIDTEHFLRRFH